MSQFWNTYQKHCQSSFTCLSESIIDYCNCILKQHKSEINSQTSIFFQLQQQQTSNRVRKESILLLFYYSFHWLPAAFRSYSLCFKALPGECDSLLINLHSVWGVLGRNLLTAPDEGWGLKTVLSLSVHHYYGSIWDLQIQRFLLSPFWKFTSLFKSYFL